ncbi:oligopeptide/dipeptide ABC transporter ATP-binding protein [Actinocorallia populi]|uniref:oligopeptide/dipeptide ABC transporter ATP-binding protein n=1 Tax=Actinocorallia populi TaxID=2079200 RepID=UPI0022B7E1AD|nr:ABC transporter ATP-binding protein [Actinocorallia populi]
MSPLLSVRDLSVRFTVHRSRSRRRVAAVTGASFDLAPGECLALVGESGCGKSVLASALLGLLPANATTTGNALLAPAPPAGDERALTADGTALENGRGLPTGPGDGPNLPTGADAGAGSGSSLPTDADTGAGSGPGLLTGVGAGAGSGPGLPTGADAGAGLEGGLDLLSAGERVLASRVRGRLVGLIPQSPAGHLTPVRTIRSQLAETIRELTGVSKADLGGAVLAAAERAAFPADHLDLHPHELSGGLAQRAATALALVGGAPLLLADEPTTGLDRDLVDRTVAELRGHVGTGRTLLMITHDLAAAEQIADRVAVMYAGRIVELTDAASFFGSPGPRHPYARRLLDALPTRAFAPIPGMPPELDALPSGCAFAPRCAAATPVCTTDLPLLENGVACHHPHTPIPHPGTDIPRLSDHPEFPADPAEPASEHPEKNDALHS